MWLEPGLNDRQKTILRLLSGKGAMGHTQLLKLCMDAGIGAKATIEKDLMVLEQYGYIKSSGGGRRGARKFYQLTDRGQETVEKVEMAEALRVELLISRDTIKELKRLSGLESKELVAIIRDSFEIPSIIQDFGFIFAHMLALYLRLTKMDEGLVLLGSKFRKRVYGVFCLPEKCLNELEELQNVYGIDMESLLTEIYKAIPFVIYIVREGLRDGTFKKGLRKVGWMSLRVKDRKVIDEPPDWWLLWNTINHILLTHEPEKFKHAMKELSKKLKIT